MYESFYGLRELPFELTPNPHYLFLTARHREALANLQYGITARRGITLLLGDAGTGKTTLVTAALGLIQRDDSRCVYLKNPTLTRAEFVEFLAEAFGLSDDATRSKTRLLYELERLLIDRLTAGVTSALFIDEAQSLSYELLEEIRLLANMETATHKLLPVVLAGQPELADRLNEPSLRQLKQRVALRCDLAPLDLRETAAYIAARIDRAGGRAVDIFTREAVETVHDCSQGIPRTISVICDNAMVSAFAVERRPVGRDIVLEVCGDLDFAPQRGANGGARPTNQPNLPAAAKASSPQHLSSPAPATAARATLEQKTTKVEESGRLAAVSRRGRFSFF